MLVPIAVFHCLEWGTPISLPCADTHTPYAKSASCLTPGPEFSALVGSIFIHVTGLAFDQSRARYKEAGSSVAG
jgi:hypothetical protein